MFTNIKSALDFIEHQINGDITFEQFQSIYNELAITHKPYTIHVTGTNGKGSTSKLLSDILSVNDLKVGLFTSPHMDVSNDRLRVNNQNISDEDLLMLINDFYPLIIKHNLNFFQIYTLIALRYFQMMSCDIVIIEVGIGGLLDSTNVIDGDLCIITNVAMDHVEKLGGSLEAITKQKAGIIKEGSTVVTHVNDEALLEILNEVTNDKKAELHVLYDVESEIVNNKQVFTYNKERYTLNSRATYQVKNAQLVLKSCECLERDGFSITKDSITNSLAQFKWSGRFEVLSEDPYVLVDGAHNLAGIEALIESTDPSSVVIFSAMQDKDYKHMIEVLQAYYHEVVFAEFGYYRGLTFDQIQSMKTFKSSDEAYTYLIKTHPDHSIIVCGSLYFVSHFRDFWRDMNGSNN